MNTTSVCMTDGTGSPRRCASHTASGSIDAATSDVISIFRGVAGMIMAPTRITMVLHDRYPGAWSALVLVQVLSSATPIAFTTKYTRPRLAFTSAAGGAYRT